MEDDAQTFVEAWMIDHAELFFEIMELEAAKRGETYCPALTQFMAQTKSAPGS